MSSNRAFEGIRCYRNINSLTRFEDVVFSITLLLKITVSNHVRLTWRFFCHSDTSENLCDVDQSQNWKVHKGHVTLYQIYHGKLHSYDIENFFPAFKYNAEKEQKNDWEAKQKELARIEEAKKAEEEKGTSFVNYICFVRIPCRNLSSHNWHNENKWFNCRF